MEKQLKIRDLRKKEQFIIDDQYLNGWAKKCGIYATGVYVSLCRHADKEQKAFPSRTKIAEELKISVRQVARAVDILESYRIIRIDRLGKKLTNRYYLLDKSEWTDSPITERTDRHITQDSQAHHIGLVGTSIERIHKRKDTQEKGLAGQAPQLNDLIKKFEIVNPSYEQLFKNKSQRSALERLVAKIGFNKLSATIEYAGTIQGQQYAPVITTPIHMENKLGELIIYYKKNQSPYTKEELDLVKDLSTSNKK